MAKKEAGTELQSNVQPSMVAVQAPAFMQAEANKGKTALIGSVRPPYLKVVKSQSKGDVKEKNGAGAVVIQPEGVRIHKPGEDEGFHFVPVFFYSEYACINPYGTDLPAIRKRTTDPQSELARRCKDPDQWKVACPEHPDKKMQNREIMTFIVMILDDAMKPMQYATMSFSGGEHKTGRRFGSMITTKQAAPFGQIYVASTSVHKYQQGKYESEGLDIEVDPDYVFVQDEDVYKELSALHDLFEAAHAEKRLESTVDVDDFGPAGEGETGEF